MIKVFIAEVITSPTQKKLVNQRMEELEQLVSTFWWMTIVKAVQQRAKPNYKTYVGSWKLDEIIHDMKLCGATLLIFWNILKPGQIYNINEILRKNSDELKLQAWDRVDLILKIFDRHAKSTEAKLQIELASIKHMWPRIFGMWMELSRQWWGIWTSWIWETNTEIMRRHLRTRRRQIETQLRKYEQVRENHRKWRQKKHLPTIWLVWYTNAGKSSLMNSLTNKWVLVENKLFATLWTDVGKLYIPSMKWKGKELLINDTIWFIRDLPPSLIQAFKSTLEDSIEADLLLHVIDTHDELWYDKIQVVDSILDNIWAKQKRIYVFNKIDMIIDIDDLKNEQKDRLVSYAEKHEYPDPVSLYVSSHTMEWLEELKTLLREH